MHRELNQGVDSKTYDLILVVALLFLLVFATALRDIVSALPFGGVLRYVVLALVLFALYRVYMQRILSYRYTLYVEDGQEYKKGTFLVERMVAEKGREALLIEPFSMVELIARDAAAAISVTDGTPARVQVKKLSVDKKSTAHTLYYRQNDKLCALLFHPSKKLIRLLEAELKREKA